MRVERSERRRGPSRRIRVILIVAAVVLFLALISLRGIAGFYTDYLWFDAQGLEDVWTGLLGARVIPAFVFTAVFFVILLGNLIIADRLAPTFVPSGPEEEFVQRYREVIGPYAGRVRVGVALLFALIAGGGVAARWHDWILFRNRVDFGIKDPQFDTDVGFYVFQLPFLKFLFEWTFAALIIVFLVVAVAHYLNGGIRVRSPFEKVTPAVKVHLSVLLAVIAVVRAAGYWLERFELNFSTRGAVHGAGYTDVNAQLPALNMLMVISLVGAVLFLVNIRRRGWVLPVLGVGLWAFVSLVIGQIYPAFIQNIRVEPNEFTREQQFIARNIEATRQAFNLDEVEQKEFTYSEDLTGEDLDVNDDIVNNIRLWDPDFVDETYRQLQRIRNFYEFRDVDIDRYVVDGQVVQTVAAAREIDANELPSRTWVNERLVFTHGYGLVLSPANGFTPEGEPEFLIQDVPPRSDVFDIDRPELYYAENQGGYAIINTQEEEFDYPQVESADAVLTRYEGDGGVAISNFLKRAAFGLRFADFRFFVSGELTNDSRVIFARDVSERVEKAAPFLRFDADPYPVVIDGRISYIVDGYTATDRYPYSQAIVPDRLRSGSGLDTRVNYVRNSVKAVVDAYHGTLEFYVIDDTDPIIRAYQKAFPELFTDGDEMPDELRAHLRYPEDLFRIQADLFATYHVDQPRAFYNRSDQWAVSTDPGSGSLDLTQVDSDGAAGGTRTTATAGGRELSEVGSQGPRMNPYYLLMRLPGEQRARFVLLQPFSPPAERELGNLLSFMVAKSDPDAYGKLEAFVMPRAQSVFGPTQVASQINTTSEIAERLTLLDQQGSDVIQGNLQLVPIEDSILYVRPIYIQAAEGGTTFPQLRFVVAFYAGDAVMAPSLEGALAQLFEDVEAPPDEEAPDEPGEEPDEPALDDTVAELLAQAQEAFERAQAALAAGNLGTYQDAIDEMGELIARAREIQEGSADPGPPDGDDGADGAEGEAAETTTTTEPAAET